MSRNTCFLLLVIVVVGAAALAGCASAPETHPYSMAAESSMPQFVHNASHNVQTAYRFAINNAHELEKYPCYCGCGVMGHTSNRACYIKDADGSNRLHFDTHAVGCGICVDITLDVMRGLDEGKTSSQIRAEIDANYSAYGPPTNTALPE